MASTRGFLSVVFTPSAHSLSLSLATYSLYQKINVLHKISVFCDIQQLVLSHFKSPFVLLVSLKGQILIKVYFSQVISGKKVVNFQKWVQEINRAFNSEPLKHSRHKIQCCPFLSIFNEPAEMPDLSGVEVIDSIYSNSFF